MGWSARARTVVRFMRNTTLLEWFTVLRFVLESPTRRARRLERALATSPRVLFVCYGNIMRSACAAAYVRTTSPALASRVFSAGTNARTGKAAEPTAVVAAASFGVDLRDHRATHLRDAGIRDDDLLVCMDWMNLVRTARAAGVRAERVFLIGDVLDSERIITDPYGQGEAVTANTFSRLLVACDRWIARLS
jgi:protein-tyrosine-phosphatase